MRERIYNVLNKIYGVILMVAFFAGIVPILPFIIAIFLGGTTGEAISVFLYEEYYPWIISASAIAVFIGWIALYFIKDKKAVKNGETEASQQKSDTVKSEQSSNSDDTK